MPGRLESESFIEDAPPAQLAELELRLADDEAFESDFWKRQVLVLEQSLQDELDSIASPGMEPLDTQFHRGKVAAIRDLLNAPNLNRNRITMLRDRFKEDDE